MASDSSSVQDEEMQGVDLDLDAAENEDGGLGDFKANAGDVTTSSIWSLDNKDDDSTKDSKDENDKSADEKKDDDATANDEDELEKPSFLRRFKRNKTDKKQEKTD